MSIRRDRENLVYRNRFVELYDDDVTFPSGQPGKYVRFVVGHPGPGVVVLARAGSRICLVRVYRYPLGADQWGLPRGMSEPGEEPVETAIREFREESGMAGAVRSVAILGWVTPDSGVLTSRVAVVEVTVDPDDVGAPSVGRDPEVSEVAWIERDDLWKRVGRGEIDDGFTLSALAMTVAGDL